MEKSQVQSDAYFRNFSEWKPAFIRRISVASNAIQTIDNETAYLIIYCLNCIRRNGNSTYKTSLRKLVRMRFFTIRYITFLRRIILGLNCVL